MDGPRIKSGVTVVCLADLSGMTVNERLFAAGLTSDYEDARASGDLKKINAVLSRVGLRQDEDGMNRSLNAQD